MTTSSVRRHYKYRAPAGSFHPDREATGVVSALGEETVDGRLVQMSWFVESATGESRWLPTLMLEEV